jgi:hypothetical protein
MKMVQHIKTTSGTLADVLQRLHQTLCKLNDCTAAGVVWSCLARQRRLTGHVVVGVVACRAHSMRKLSVQQLAMA